MPEAPKTTAAFRLPSKTDPETVRQLAAQRSHYHYVKGEPVPINKFCVIPGCGYALVKMSMFTADPKDSELVCGFDPEGYPKGNTGHPQPKE